MFLTLAEMMCSMLCKGQVGLYEIIARERMKDFEIMTISMDQSIYTSFMTYKL